MNKILNINLGGYALTIDDDAYEYLQAYLESIRKRFSESEGRDEHAAYGEGDGEPSDQSQQR